MKILKPVEREFGTLEDLIRQMGACHNRFMLSCEKAEMTKEVLWSGKRLI